MIIGIDEVGRGAWAGPLVVAAVGLGGVEIVGLTDSKLLSKKKREKLSLEIKQAAPLVGIGWVSAHDIDIIGLSKALQLAASRAIYRLDLTEVSQIIIDGTINFLQPASPLQGSSLQTKVTMMKKADVLVPSCSAASVIAKVARDAYMAGCDDIFPDYGFRGHVGYGAAKHRAAIERYGTTPLHRMCFEPMKSMFGDRVVKLETRSSKTYNISQLLKNVSKQSVEKPEDLDKFVTTTIGNKAEDAAWEYLKHQGYELVDRNWKTKWCEVDIIAKRAETVYFVEVKYRKRPDQGGGIAAITPKKLGHMRFAAKLWLHIYGEQNARLSAIEVSGQSFDITAHIENIE